MIYRSIELKAGQSVNHIDAYEILHGQNVCMCDCVLARSFEFLHTHVHNAVHNIVHVIISVTRQLSHDIMPLHTQTAAAHLY